MRRKQRNEDLDRRHVDPPEWLVQQQQLRLGRERSGDFEPLALPGAAPLAGVVRVFRSSPTTRSISSAAARAAPFHGSRAKAAIIVFSKNVMEMNGPRGLERLNNPELRQR